MSNTEAHVGTLTQVAKVTDSETTTEMIIRLLGDVELVDKEEYLFEQLQEIDDNYKKYILFRGILYEADNTECTDDICQATESEDGKIHYALHFYNGGTCFTEMMEDALNKLP